MIFDLDAAARGELDDVLEKMRLRATASTLAMEPYIVALADAGWTVPHHLSIDGPQQVLQNGGPDAADAFFISHYERGFGKAFRDLRKSLLQSEHFSPWQPLLVECFAAYRRRRYRLVVPSLLLIVEGGVADLIGRPHARVKIPRVAREWTQNAEPGGWVWFGLRSIQQFLGNLFMPREFSSARPAVLNRHWILHGRDRPDWDHADALRLFHCLATINVTGWFVRRYSLLLKPVPECMKVTESIRSDGLVSRFAGPLERRPSRRARPQLGGHCGHVHALRITRWVYAALAPLAGRRRLGKGVAREGRWTPLRPADAGLSRRRKPRNVIRNGSS